MRATDMNHLGLKPKHFWIIGSIISGACFSALLFLMLLVALVLAAGASGEPAPAPMQPQGPVHQVYVPNQQDNFWSTQHTAGNANAANSQGYVNVPGHGPVGYGF
jgi:ABC-type sugar transport system substrate-binding protein